jgi:hypothetical protein
MAGKQDRQDQQAKQEISSAFPDEKQKGFARTKMECHQLLERNHESIFEIRALVFAG